MMEGYELFEGEICGAGSKITRRQLRVATSRFRPPVKETSISPRVVWSILWALVSAQNRLVRLISLCAASAGPSASVYMVCAASMRLVRASMATGLKWTSW